MPRSAQAGLGLPAAIFLLVVLWLLGAFIVSIFATQQSEIALDAQGARAYQAARAGVEWAAYHVLDPNNVATPLDQPESCPGASGGNPSTTTLPALAGTLAGFTVTVVCTPTDATESNRTLRLFRIVSTATHGAVGTSGYVERKLEAVLSKCKNPAAPAPHRCGS